MVCVVSIMYLYSSAHERAGLTSMGINHEISLFLGVCSNDISLFFMYEPRDIVAITICRCLWLYRLYVVVMHGCALCMCRVGLYKMQGCRYGGSASCGIEAQDSYLLPF